MVNVLISSYRHRTTGVIVLISADSGEQSILNLYRGILSIREKAHGSDDCDRVWWCEEMKSWTSVSSTFTATLDSRPTHAIQFNAMHHERTRNSLIDVVKACLC